MLLSISIGGCKGDGESNDSTADDSGSTGIVEDESGGSDDGATEVVPPPGGMRTQLSYQYVETIRYLLGDAAAEAAIPPEDEALGGFDVIGAAQLPLPPTSVEQYERSALAIADAAVENPGTLAALVPCVTAGEDASCYEEVARKFGRLAFRRPLTDEEVQGYVALAEDARDWMEGSFLTGVEYEIAGILQSPSFLYIVEVGQERDDGTRALDGFELATRMSYFLIGRTPDAELLDRAEAGELETEDQVRQAATQLVNRVVARETVKRFWSEVYRLRELPTKGKDAELFPNFTPELAAAMERETLLLVEDFIFERDGNVLDLFSTQETYVNDELAELYGIAAPNPGGWGIATLPASQGRAGLLTRSGFLGVFSFPTRNSPTRRGLFVQEKVLCNDIPSPPPEVNTTLPEPTEPKTLRERLEIHMTNTQCRACHGAMDPIGFAFEGFDAVGAFRTTDNGFPIDTTGDVAGIGAFANATELATILRDHPQTPTCLVRQLYRSSFGVVETPEQTPELEVLYEAFAASEYNMKQLMIELTSSPLFRLVDAPR